MCKERRPQIFKAVLLFLNGDRWGFVNSLCSPSGVASGYAPQGRSLIISRMSRGNTEFQFKVANLNFHSDSYEWLVIAGAKAQFKGSGSNNGEGLYKFMLTGIDAEINKADSFTVDRFRIKIWTENEYGEEGVVYDNALGDDLCSTEISGGSIVIHK